MNEIISNQLESLMEQRKSLLQALEHLDEHSSNYEKKEQTLNNQVMYIDGNISNIMLNLEKTIV